MTLAFVFQPSEQLQGAADLSWPDADIALSHTKLTKEQVYKLAHLCFRGSDGDMQDYEQLLDIMLGKEEVSTLLITCTVQILQCCNVLHYINVDAWKIFSFSNTNLSVEIKTKHCMY